jgi:hypothetical protein
MRHSLLAALTVLLLPALSFAQGLSTSSTGSDMISSGTPLPNEGALMAQGTVAYNNGDLNGAATFFIQVAQADPHNALAIQFLRKIRAGLLIQQAAANPSSVNNLVLPKITLNQATFGAALDFFKSQAAQQNVTVSFVTQLPAQQLLHPVTLNLSQVPFLDALNYLCQLNNATYRVDPYAIVILPKSPTATQ